MRKTSARNWKHSLHLSRPELERALEWTRQAARDLDGWRGQPTDPLPAMCVEVMVMEGQASARPLPKETLELRRHHWRAGLFPRFLR